MIIYFAIMAFFGGLLLFSGRTEIPEEFQQENLKKPFLKAAWLLAGKRRDVQLVQRLGESMLGLLDLVWRFLPSFLWSEAII